MAVSRGYCAALGRLMQIKNHRILMRRYVKDHLAEIRAAVFGES